MDLSTALTTLDTILGDSEDVTFSSSEKTRAMTRAWDDAYVVAPAWDTSLTYSTGTYRYSLPATISSVQDIYISPVGSSSPFPEPIDSSLWEAIDDEVSSIDRDVRFTWRADNIIPDGSTLYIKGRYKIRTSDSISNPVMQEYVLALAGVYTLTMLTHKKANLFTKNDVTMSELIGLRRELQQDVDRLRRQLTGLNWESA